jgi:uncharacterized membrane protein YedE/YeeE
LTPAREYLAGLWVTPGGRNVDLLSTSGMPDYMGLVMGVALAVLALEISRRNRIGFGRLVFASGVGFAVAVGWVLTFGLSQVAFEPVQIESATFTGPSAHTLMYFLDRNAVLEFDIGLVPGVFIGALISAALTRELRWQAFDNALVMRKAMIGAVLMGFGGMLAGGCAIGAGVTGGSIFVATAWLALFCMWIGAMATDYLIDQKHLATA